MSEHDLDAGTAEALIRLAEALDPGGEPGRPARLSRTDLPPGRGLRVLDEEECLQLLDSETIGRIAYTGPRGPAVLPVTFALVRGRPVFRTAESSSLAGLEGQRVAFEVDCVDHARREGWSVVVAGVAHARLAPEVGPDATMPTVAPWPGGRREVYVVVEPLEMTGRRVLSPVEPDRRAGRPGRPRRRPEGWSIRRKA